MKKKKKMRWLTAFGLLVFLVAAAFSPLAAAIECTNYISNRAPGSNNEKYGTHYQQARMNDTWLHGFLSRYHLTPSDDAAWITGEDIQVAGGYAL